MKKVLLFLIFLGFNQSLFAAYLPVAHYQASLVQLVQMAEQTRELLEAIAPTIEILENLPDTFSEIEIEVRSEGESASVEKKWHLCPICRSKWCPGSYQY